MKDGSVLTRAQLLSPSGGQQFRTVLDLSQVASVIYGYTEFPTDGSAPRPAQLDARLYPFRTEIIPEPFHGTARSYIADAAVLCRGLGADCSWDPVSRSLTAVYRGTTLELDRRIFHRADRRRTVCHGDGAVRPIRPGRFRAAACLRQREQPVRHRPGLSGCLGSGTPVWNLPITASWNCHPASTLSSSPDPVRLAPPLRNGPREAARRVVAPYGRHGPRKAGARCVRPYGEPRPFPRYGGRGKPLPYGITGKHSPQRTGGRIWDPPADSPPQRLDPERSGAPVCSSRPGHLDFRPAAAAARLRGQSLPLPRLTVTGRLLELGSRKFRGSGGERAGAGGNLFLTAM